MKLVIVRSYNQYIGGADCVDQQLKWHTHIMKKLAFTLLSQCMLNPYNIYEKKTRQKKTFLDFMLDVIMQLITLKHEAPFPRELVVDDRVSRLSGRHFPSSKVPQPGAVDK